jgi:hypothetical protein
VRRKCTRVISLYVLWKERAPNYHQDATLINLFKHFSYSLQTAQRCFRPGQLPGGFIYNVEGICRNFAKHGKNCERVKKSYEKRIIINNSIDEQSAHQQGDAVTYTLRHLSLWLAEVPF